MPKGKTELQKHTLNLTPGDYAKLQGYYPDIGAATIIRRIVHRYVENIEERGGPPIDTDVDVNL